MADGSWPQAHGKIGPNAILQLVPVLERAGGRALRDRILALGGVFELPSDDGLMSEVPAGLVHQAMRRELPDLAPMLAWEAGRRTADYIMAHRIPAFAQMVLKHLPAQLAAPILTKAISSHAWTFVGSGTFQAHSPYCFEIMDNPIISGETADHPVCHWHAAVFETLYGALVRRTARCTEVSCRAAGAPSCKFEITL